ncbi:MAG: helix-turn-helix transcriptional regulator [Haloarculaceae archaeon]
MRRSRRVALAVVAATVLWTAFAAVPTAASQSAPPRSIAAPAPGGSAATNATTPARDPDSVLMRADVGADGTATWRLEYRFRLTEPGERESFQSFRADVEANRSAYESAFADRIRPAVRAAGNQTGREMAMDNVTVSVREQQLAQPTGIVAYTFTWREFARANATTIRVGDAIRGFYLGPNTKLTVAWPSGYRLDAAVPGPTTSDADRLTWQGELGFGRDEPRVVLVAAGADGTAGGVPVALVGGVGLLVLLGAAGAVFVRRRSRGRDDDAPAAATADAATATAASADASDPDLLTDEERALAVVSDAGGRLKQQELADACGWSESKTSRVVGRLREDGDLEVLRLGRENVLALPGEDDDEN